MIQFANAKINLGLHIINKRPDGYHNLETVFYPIPLYDVVEVVRADQIRFFPSGLPIGEGQNDRNEQKNPDVQHDQNLCIRAYHLLKADFDLPPVEIHLHKSIPIGAGLGGGSSDAAATLWALNEEFQLGLAAEKLEEYAGRLGADCPFFVRNQPVFASGTGTDFEPVDLSLKGKYLLMLWPALHISTAEAYRTCIPRGTGGDLKNLIRQPISRWRSTLVNDFENSLFPAYPILTRIKAQLYDMGAEYAAMSGSGSALFGLFERAVQEEDERQLKEMVPEAFIYRLSL